MSALMEFITAITPRYKAPQHLAPLVSVFERIIGGEQVFATVAVPPRHEKTDTIGAAIAYGLRVRPTMRFGYATYSQPLSASKSRRFRAMADRARVRLDAKAAQLGNWRTRVPRGEEPGGLLATSTGGPFTGEGVDVLIVDDPVKDRVSAESALIRDRLHEWFTNTAFPRLEPGGSVIVNMHRWHTDDLIGRLLSEGGYEEISLPAITASGEALLPERFTLPQLLQIRERVGEYTWQSLYMQNPVARGGAIFGGGVRFYTELPATLTFAIGVDLAYSKKSSADASVAVVLARDAAEKYYVVEVLRVREEAPVFLERLRSLRARYAGAPLVMYAAGTERGVIDTFRTMGVDIAARPAILDKFTRAQPVSAAWTAGKVLVPGRLDGPSVAAPKWVNDFVAEVTAFTGADRHDDQVDALAAAFDELATGGLDLSTVTRTQDGGIHLGEPLGPASLVVGGTPRETAAIVVQRQRLDGREVLRILAAERLPRSIDESVIPIWRLAHTHDVARVCVAHAPFRMWREALRDVTLPHDATDVSPHEIEDGRAYVESLIRDSRLVVDTREVSSELAALDVNASAYVATIVHVGRLALSHRLHASMKHVIYDNDEEAEDIQVF